MGQGSLGVESALTRRCLDLQKQIFSLQEQICHLQHVIQAQHHGLRGVIQEVRLARRPTGQVFRGRENKREALGFGLSSLARVLGMSSLLVTPCLGLCTPRSDIRTRFEVKMRNDITVKMGLLWWSWQLQADPLSSPRAFLGGRPGSPLCAVLPGGDLADPGMVSLSSGFHMKSTKLLS